MAITIGNPGGNIGGGVSISDEGPALGAAFVSGVRRHPILGPAFDTAASLFGYDRQRLQALEDTIGTETTSEKLAGLVGEIGPDFIIGGAVMGLGRAAGLGVLRSVAAGKTVGQLGQVAARTARDAELAALRLGVSGARTPAARDAILRSAAALKPLATPGVEVAAKAVGGQAALATYFGGEDYLRTGDVNAALETAALTAAIGGVLEGVPVLAGRYLTARGRAGRLDQEALRAGANTSVVQKAATKLEEKTIPTLGAKLTQLNEELEVALGVQQYASNMVRAGELEKALKKLPGLIKKQEQALASAETLLGASEGFLARTGADVLLTTNKPFVPKGVKRTLFEAARRVAVPPEALEGRMGASAARFFSGLSHAEMKVNLAGTIHHEQVGQARDAFMKALGLRPHVRDRAQRELLWRVLHEWEKPGGSAQAVVAFLMKPPAEWAGRLPKHITAAQIDDVLTAIKYAKTQLADVGERVARVGAEPLMTAADRAALRVEQYWPHLADPALDDTAILARLSGQFGDDAASQMMKAAEGEGWLPSQRIAMQQGPSGHMAKRIGKFAAHDFARSVPGTGWEKLKLGLPINDDPFDALGRYLKAGERRFHFAQVVGPKGELVRTVAGAVREEVTAVAQQAQAAERLAGKTPKLLPRAEGTEMANLFTNVADELLDHRFYREGVIRFSRTLTALNTASKLAFGVIPQLS